MCTKESNKRFGMPTRLTVNLRDEVFPPSLSPTNTEVRLRNVVDEARVQVSDALMTILRSPTGSNIEHRLPLDIQKRLHNWFKLSQDAQMLYGCHTFVRFLAEDTSFDPHLAKSPLFEIDFEVLPNNVSKCKPGDIVIFSKRPKKEMRVYRGMIQSRMQIPNGGVFHSAMYIGNGKFISKLGEDYLVAISTFDELMSLYSHHGAETAFKSTLNYS